MRGLLFNERFFSTEPQDYDFPGCGATVVMLIPARTDTSWFHNYIYHKAEIRFIRGRLKFGGNKNSAPFPSMIVVFYGGE